MQTAKSYYSYILSKSTNNTRALWGLYQVLKTLAALKKTEEKDIELLEVFIASNKIDFFFSS